MPAFVRPASPWAYPLGQDLAQQLHRVFRIQPDDLNEPLVRPIQEEHADPICHKSSVSEVHAQTVAQPVQAFPDDHSMNVRHVFVSAPIGDVLLHLDG